MEFQNTIGFAQYYSAGGQFTVASGQAYTSFRFIPSVSDGVEKNICLYGTTEFGIEVKQTGAYYIDFSFIAEQGDAKRYTISPYIDGSEVSAKSRLEFYQQPDNMQYEVSGSWVLNLTREEKVAIYLSGSAVPTENFYTKDIKMSIFCLQQLGIH